MTSSSGKTSTVDSISASGLTLANRNLNAPGGKPRTWGMLITITNDPTPANNITWYLKYNQASTNLFDNTNWVAASTELGGGAPGGVDTELQLNNAGAFGGAGVYSPAHGDFTFGSDANPNRIIKAASSGASANLVFQTQGSAGSIYMQREDGTGTSIILTTNGSPIILEGSGSTNSSISGGSGTGSFFTIQSYFLGSDDDGSASILLKSGDGGTGGIGFGSGDICFDTGTPFGAGKYGNISFFSSTPSVGGAEKALFWANTITIPTLAVAGGGVMYVKSSNSMPYWWTGTTEYPYVLGNLAQTLTNKTIVFSAGSTTAGTAPIKLQSGSLNTVAEVGAWEFLTDKVYFTITTGAARKEITLNDTVLTSGRVALITTNGRLTDNSGITIGSNAINHNINQSAPYGPSINNGSNTAAATAQISIQTTGTAAFGTTSSSYSVIPFLGVDRAFITASNTAGFAFNLTAGDFKVGFASVEALNLTSARLNLTGNLVLTTAGNGVQIKEGGANARAGVSTLAAGTVVVANTSITANTRIKLTAQDTGLSTGHLRVSSRVVGTSFTILSTVGADTCPVYWELQEPAP